MRKPLGIVVAAAIVVGGGIALWATLRPSPAGKLRDPHVLAKFAPGEMDRILAAAGAITQKASQTELIAKGRVLFRSTTLAQRGESCQTCHADGSATPVIGVIPHNGPTPDKPNEFKGPRESIAMWGLARSAPYGWASQTPTIEAFATNTIKNFFKDHDPTAERVAAMSAYLRSLQPPVTAFDLGTLSAAAKRGMVTFTTLRNATGKTCSTCHVATGPSPLFTDGLVHNIGTPRFVFPDATTDTDPGAATAAGCVDAAPCFNTPILRDVRNTAPYMHNGTLATLTDVVSFYKNPSTLAFPLNAQNITDLVAFLESL